VTFPVRLKHHSGKATIYRKTKGFPYYRPVYRVDGKRKVEAIKSYGEAKEAGEKKVKELAKGGERSQRSPKYLRKVSATLKAFANMHPGCLVSDLARDHVDIFFDRLDELSPKTRNHCAGVASLLAVR
jgi:hypothetical protein